MRGRIAHPSASIATLTERWGDRCEVVRDLLGGRWSVMRHNGEESTFLASGKTPEDAVTAALALWPACAYCGGGVTEEAKTNAWPMCGQCPDTQLPEKWEPKAKRCPACPEGRDSSNCDLNFKCGHLP